MLGCLVRRKAGAFLHLGGADGVEHRQAEGQRACTSTRRSAGCWCWCRCGVRVLVQVRGCEGQASEKRGGKGEKSFAQRTLYTSRTQSEANALVLSAEPHSSKC